MITYTYQPHALKLSLRAELEKKSKFWRGILCKSLLLTNVSLLDIGLSWHYFASCSTSACYLCTKLNIDYCITIIYNVAEIYKKRSRIKLLVAEGNFNPIDDRTPPRWLVTSLIYVTQIRIYCKYFKEGGVLYRIEKNKD